VRVNVPPTGAVPTTVVDTEIAAPAPDNEFEAVISGKSPAAPTTDSKLIVMLFPGVLAQAAAPFEKDSYVVNV
jgi:hypothetical protein